MRLLAAILITIFWASMTGLLLQRELFPKDYADHGFPSVAPEYLRPSASRMGIYFNDRRIGVSDTRIRPLKDGSVNIINVSNVELELLRKQKFAIRLSMQLDPGPSLRQFQMDVQWPLGQTGVRGRVLGDQLEVTTVIPQGERRHVLPYDSQAIVSSSISPLMVMPRLDVGRKWRIRTWNPLNMQMELVSIEVTAKTTLPWKGQDQEVYVLEVTHPNITCKAWVTPEGETLQQEFPLGRFALVLRKEELPNSNDPDSRADQELR